MRIGVFCARNKACEIITVIKANDRASMSGAGQANNASTRTMIEKD